jgi:hypothetical protein
MAIPGKEEEGLPTEEIALKEVEGYIEAIEKKPEIDQSVAPYVQSSQVPTPPPVTDQAGQVVMQPIEPVASPISLPLTEPEIQEGLHHPIIEAFRWLAEFCVFLIKKYPGRVFYSQKKE